MKHKFGFTLAEALIALTLIGVISAITLPAVVGNYEKKIVGVKLNKFYSQMNRAMAQYIKNNNIIPDDMPYPTSDAKADTKTWWEDTIGKEFTGANELNVDSERYCLSLRDGTVFCLHRGTYVTSDGNYLCVNIHFYTDAKYAGLSQKRYDGQHGFLFAIAKGKLYASGPNNATQWPTRASLIESCKKCDFDSAGTTTPGKCHACARLIQIDGWELKSDYPWNKVCVGSGCGS